MAHAIKSQFNSFADALRQAWKVLKLSIRLKKETVSFRFKKVDGSIREAIGTLNVQYERKTDSAPKFDTVAYYDLEANGFRSFKTANLC